MRAEQIEERSHCNLPLVLVVGLRDARFELFEALFGTQQLVGLLDGVTLGRKAAHKRSGTLDEMSICSTRICTITKT